MSSLVFYGPAYNFRAIPHNYIHHDVAMGNTSNACICTHANKKSDWITVLVCVRVPKTAFDRCGECICKHKHKKLKRRLDRLVGVPQSYRHVVSAH